MSDSGAAPAADGGGSDSGALSDGQFGDVQGGVTDTTSAPYTAQDPYGPVLGVWGFGRTLFSKPRHPRHRRKHHKR